MASSSRVLQATLRSLREPDSPQGERLGTAGFRYARGGADHDGDGDKYASEATRYHGVDGNEARTAQSCRPAQPRETAMDPSSLLWGMIFGSIGLGFFIYGKKQQAVVPLLCGLALMIFPYFVSNVIVLVIVGVALMAIPYFVRI
jgi:hypothetical protein